MTTKFPRELARFFDFIQLLSDNQHTSVFLVEEKKPSKNKKQKFIIKFFNKDVKLNHIFFNKLNNISENFILKDQKTLLNCNVSHLNYQIFDYIEYGSLHDFLLKNNNLNDVFTRQIISEINTILNTLYGKYNIVHKNLNPKSILIKSLNPIKIILINFDIYEEETVGKSVQYSCFESIPNSSNEKKDSFYLNSADYWSLGHIIYELITQKHLFENLSENQIKYLALTSSEELNLSNKIPSDYELICKGLLSLNPKIRWNSKQVNQWLNNEKITIDNEAYLKNPVLAIVAEYTIQNWEKSKYLFKNQNTFTSEIEKLPCAIKNKKCSMQEKKILKELFKDYSFKHEEQRMLALIAHCFPNKYPVWRGYEYTPENLTQLCIKAQEKSFIASKLIEHIYDNNIFSVYSKYSSQKFYADWENNIKNHIQEYQEIQKIFNKYIQLACYLQNEKQILPILCHNLLNPIVSLEINQQVHASIKNQDSFCNLLPEFKNFIQDKKNIAKQIILQSLIIPINQLIEKIEYDLKKANDFFNQKNYNDAVKFYKKYLELAPNNILVYYNLYLSLKELQEDDQAIEILQKALEYSNKEPFFMYLLGMMYSEKKLYTNAIHIFQQLKKQYPKEYDVYFFLGYCYKNNNQTDKAKDSFDEYIKIAPEKYKSTGHLFKGNIYFQQKQFHNSIHEYKNAEKIESDEERKKEIKKISNTIISLIPKGNKI